MRWLRTILWMILFCVAVLFSIQNRGEVTLRFGLYPLRDLVWMELPQVPLFLVILFSIFLGLLIGGLADSYRRFQLKRTLRQNQKTIERLEKEVNSLRSSKLDSSYRPAGNATQVGNGER